MRHPLVEVIEYFFTQFKNFCQDELPKTLLTTHFTALQRRYPGEHNVLTALTPYDYKKLHTTDLPINTNIKRKLSVVQWMSSLRNPIKREVRYQSIVPAPVGFGYWRSAVTPDNCEAM